MVAQAHKHWQDTTAGRPPLEDVFHEILKTVAERGVFIHGGGHYGLAEVARRLNVYDEDIGTEYIVRGLSEYWDRDEKFEVLKSETRGDISIRVFACTVIDPVTKAKYRVVVAVAKGPGGEYYEIRSANGINPYSEAEHMAWRAELAVKGRRAFGQAPEKTRRAYRAAPDSEHSTGHTLNS